MRRRRCKKILRWGHVQRRRPFDWPWKLPKYKAAEAEAKRNGWQFDNLRSVESLEHQEILNSIEGGELPARWSKIARRVAKERARVPGNPNRLSPWIWDEPSPQRA